MKAMSKGVSLSFVRHWTQGSLANVVMPEKIASAVTSNNKDSIYSSRKEAHLHRSFHDIWVGRET